jgi:hypothetical protein
MAWYVRFIPNECDSISALVNNEQWTKWYRTAGDQTQILPMRFRDLPRIKIGATVSPEGKNGSLEVKWDDRVVKRYDFDNYEDHDLSNAPPPPPQRPDPRSAFEGWLGAAQWVLVPLAAMVGFRSRVTKNDTGPRRASTK